MSRIAAIVDDDESILEPITLLLETYGWDAVAYMSGEEFLEALDADGLPECLILDLHFPRMNGVEVLKALSTRNFNLPTIILTAYPDGPLTRPALEAGAIEVLVKPVDADRLIDAVQNAVDGLW